jgi:7-cyano-7-deazaguanine synthase
MSTPEGQSGVSAVVLLSGGLDSAVALAMARRECGSPSRCAAISVDYGQRHRSELTAARRVASSLGVFRHLIVNIDLRAIGGSALTADVDVPKDRTDGEIEVGIPITYVPARNMLFLSLAIGAAESLGASAVYIGVNQVDYSGYPDCREAFIRAMEQAAALGTRQGVEGEGGPIRIETPLAHLSKSAIICRGLDLGVDFSLTTSCYDPVPIDGPAEQPTDWSACGRCDSCRIRSRGFAEAGVADPTRYAGRAS